MKEEKQLSSGVPANTKNRKQCRTPFRGVPPPLRP
ncbi:hypothetical protein AVEN_171877-1, partial [Araneus ventricosus]